MSSGFELIYLFKQHLVIIKFFSVYYQ